MSLRDELYRSQNEELKLVRSDMIEAILRYVENRLPPGSFLTYVLENNLVRAAQSADAQNVIALTQIAKMVGWYLPYTCWGSPERVEAWLLGEGEGDADI